MCQERRKAAAAAARWDALLSAGIYPASGRRELAASAPGALGKLGSESAAGSRDRKPGLAVEKLKARLLLLFPGCPRADVALSHCILPDAAWGKRRGRELWGAGGPGCSPSR